VFNGSSPRGFRGDPRGFGATRGVILGAVQSPLAKIS